MAQYKECSYKNSSVDLVEDILSHVLALAARLGSELKETMEQEEEEARMHKVEFDPSEIEYAFHKGKCVGTVVCKMGEHRSTFRGYIAMLVVIKPYRGRGIATELVTRSIKVMMESGCEEVTLEAEVTNKGALALYGRLGFIRAKRLFRYYLNGVDAFRLKLLFPCPEIHPSLSMMADKVESHGHHDHIAPEECPEHHHIS
ncbi:N-alpha-acetyltransferase MAK3 [Citrus sinensis]|nr:N-alpha-acetyltransferase MAK3 [Citrus sinensis]